MAQFQHLRKKTPKLNETEPSNPCNTFLVNYLQMMRRIALQRRQDRTFGLYTRAMISIRKYPLPIICPEQLELLRGIGPKLSNELLTIIKKHYSHFLFQNDTAGVSLTNPVLEPNSLLNEEVISDNQEYQPSESLSSSKSLPKFQKPHFDFGEKGLTEKYSADFAVDRPTKLALAYSEKKDLGRHEIDEISQESRGISSGVKSAKVTREYKPKPNSKAHVVLASIHSKLCIMHSDEVRWRRDVRGLRQYLMEREINKFEIFDDLRKEGKEGAVKKWSQIQDTLVAHGYLSLNDQNPNMITLTAKSLEIIQYTKRNKGLTKEETVRIKEDIKSFKEAAESINLQQQSKAKSCHSKARAYRLNEMEGKAKKELSSLCNCLVDQKSTGLILLIDTREATSLEARSHLCHQLSAEKLAIPHKITALPLGDFMFYAPPFLLATIIERKTADDLANSIIDGRYIEQKYRLHQSGMKQIVFIFEGHLSRGAPISQSALQTALLKMRLSDGFKVIETKDINQTLLEVSYFYQWLTEDMAKNCADTVGTMTDFRKNSSKSGSLTVKQAFGLSLKAFPGIGTESIFKILNYFKTWGLLRACLEDKQEKQRQVFLRELLKGERLPTSFIPMLLTLLFADKYE